VAREGSVGENETTFGVLDVNVVWNVIYGGAQKAPLGRHKVIFLSSLLRSPWSSAPRLCVRKLFHGSKFRVGFALHPKRLHI
jgi:hypothetical protein